MKRGTFLGLLLLWPLLGYFLLCLISPPYQSIDNLAFSIFVFVLCVVIYVINLPACRKYTDALFMCLVLFQFAFMGGLEIFSVIRDLFKDYGFIGGLFRLIFDLYPFAHHLIARKMKFSGQ